MGGGYIRHAIRKTNGTSVRHSVGGPVVMGRRERKSVNCR